VSSSFNHVTPESRSAKADCFRHEKCSASGQLAINLTISHLLSSPVTRNLATRYFVSGVYIFNISYFGSVFISPSMRLVK
jgi:hypothetical protein